ncbi:MAG: peptidylprolyl isomerase [Rhodoferax sp.]|nr:peptidylprolyl isomerase [Rhodoferax sp.]
MDTHATSTECGGSSCQCAPETSAVEASVPRINGIALHELGEAHDANTLRELAYSEILRQQAITLGLLPPQVGNVANPLTDAEREIVEAMVDQSIHIPEPTEEECQRYFDANKGKFVVGQELHLRHILFAVTPGVNVQALSGYAEKVLLELSGKNVPSDRFTQLAAELSNCPTGKEGGDLGWIGPQSCVSELSAELFHKQNGLWGMGLHPRLVHTRFGFHIIDVLDRRVGVQKEYAEVRERIAAQLSLQSRAKALYQFMTILVGEATVEGVNLDAANSPLVQ